MVTPDDIQERIAKIREMSESDLTTAAMELGYALLESNAAILKELRGIHAKE